MKEPCTKCISLELIVSGLERMEGEKTKIFQVRKELEVKLVLPGGGVKQNLLVGGGVK